MSESITSDIVCSRCNTGLKATPGDIMEKCPSCGAFLVWENPEGDVIQTDLALTRQIDGNFDPGLAAATKQVVAECQDPDHLIPATSRFALQLLPILQDPNFDLMKLSNHIEKDQAIAANLFKVANSAYYQGRGTITRINEALVRLGIKQTQAVILATISRQMHLIKNDRFGIVGDKLWYHAVATSFACRELAQATDHVDPDEAYAAGLLHDIGRVVTLRAINELSLAKKIKLDDDPTDAAISMMDFLHIRMGERLLTQWGIPNVLTLPAVWHHSGDDPQECTEIVRIVKAMNALSTVAGFGSSVKSATDLTEETIAAQFGFDVDVMKEIRELLQ